jgi:hypothetical protein
MERHAESRLVGNPNDTVFDREVMFDDLVGALHVATHMFEDFEVSRPAQRWTEAAVLTSAFGLWRVIVMYRDFAMAAAYWFPSAQKFECWRREIEIAFRVMM